MPDILFEVIGWIGSGFLIIAYVLVSSRKLNPESSGYQLINLSGAICLLAYAIYTSAYPFILVNFIWLIIGLTFFVKIYMNKK